MALYAGTPSPEQIDHMRTQVPKQEQGRMSADMLVLSRANKSSRNFNYVVNQLAAGQQPDPDILTQVGYLFRTTAVYGSGKFGMADWHKVKQHYPDFARPFAAEMFTCFMLRHASLELAEYLARVKSPKSAVPLNPEIRRYFGIGNSTGLGMAPFLIKHPKLISRWLWARETALSRIMADRPIAAHRLDLLRKMLGKAHTHFCETTVPDLEQQQKNQRLVSELEQARRWLTQQSGLPDWSALTDWAAQHWHFETQELINSLLLELYPERVDDLDQQLCADEQQQLQPQMSLKHLRQLIENDYAWVLDIDFQDPDADYLFWYRSEEKMEPRLGVKGIDIGAEKQMPLPIARGIRQCYDRLCEELRLNPNTRVAEFLLRAPEVAASLRRVQSMASEHYGEIRANLASRDMAPMNLLRCKLSFFGVSKFDPKSKLWVRNTMFQGAPVVADIGSDFADDWYFPIAPRKLQPRSTDVIS